MQPTVSIIVPVYNAEATLRRCVDSILNQDYRDFELILVNDGSQDGSGAICDAYAAQDPRVTAIHKPNTGVSDTRNLAISRAQGTYLQFLDSDDWITPDATTLLVQTAQQHSCDLVISDFYRVVGERVSRKGDIDDDTVLSREEYAAHMMGSGVHTSRVKRSSKRIGKAFNTDIKLNVSQKTIVISATHNETGETYSEVVDIPALPISFEHNAELSALSWETYDQHLSLEEVRQKYNEIVSAPKMDPMFVLILVGLANASFCRLFGGDWLSMGIVLSATITGMFLRQRMQANHINHYVVFAVSAFVASLCASTSLIFDTTSEIALATSVLYLIPGVPLINGIIDIVEGETLIGCSRLISAFLLIICIAIGMSFTLMLVKNSLI